MGLRRHFWSDQVGICRTRLPAVRAGRAEELTVETEFRGKNYSRTFTLLGKRLLEQDLLSQIDAENNYRYRALKLKALVAKEAPAVGGTLAPLRVLQKETGDLWAAWMKSKDPEVDKRYEQKKEQLSKLQRQVDEYQEKLQNEVDDLRNQANQLADQVRQSKEENDPAKSRLRGLADTYQTKSDKQMQFRLQLELLRIAGDRDEDVRRQQGNGTSAEVRAREIRDAAASRASDILHAFQEAADSALATNRWRELEDLLKGWQRALDQAKSMDKTFLIDLTRCAEAYAGMLWTWACAVGDSAELNKAIQLLQQQRKENGSWDHEPWVKGIAKPLEINEWQMLARVTAETTGDGQQAAEYWLQAEKIEKELGEPVERPELTTRLLYPEQHHNRVPVEKLEAYRPGWWPNKS
jgi:outer membrane murein-binding lipoprotein Lpp